MKLLDACLKVKTSTLPGCGNGLFTTMNIKKGTRISEYRGKVTTWNLANHDEGNNPYIFYVTRNHVIDGKKEKKYLAHYANDAKGHKRFKGITNNAVYVLEGKKVYIDAIKNIPAGNEILVGYGKEYWAVMRKNGILK